MKKLIGLVLLAMWLVSAGCSQKEIGVANFSAGQVQHVIVAIQSSKRQMVTTLCLQLMR